ncbi:hypothetical protein RND71_021041 [Anisodus tanguticus]|uniref:Endonuclease/exonuclease/phosphatase domain-containing protein n=1 Tax=Anisodus tanguticus TaxID=243964 RepID=A0AAE1RWI4_9SOLA|nr:hypothetical protein RND71_021041 [Anisodus tanguticus]
MMKWGHVSTTYDVPLISDHSPMILSLCSNSVTGKASFKFFNVWSEHPNLLLLVENTRSKYFSTNSMKNVWLKLQGFKPALRKLNNTKFKYISQKITKAREDLIAVQERISKQATNALIDLEKETILNLEK